ncbi:MAG: hypothetical protein ABSB94_14350 [Syntrophorhabdales bacterium]
MKKKFAVDLLLTIVLASFVLVGSAGAVTLGDLINTPGAAITIDNQTFSDFGCSSALGTSAINVLPVDAPSGGPGLAFVNSGLVYTSAQNIETSFSVQVPTSVPMAINNVLLGFSALIGSNGSATVTEYVYANSTERTELATVTLTVTQSGTYQAASGVLPSYYKSLYIVDNITMNAGDALAGVSGMHYLQNNFSDPPPPVPLPPALLLFGPGLAGLVAIRRRFKK